MAKRWRGALIGCGFFAPNHLHAWQANPAVDIVAICDLDKGKAQAMGGDFRVNAAYQDAAEMLDQQEVDFLDIVTTPPSHRALVELGASHRKLVICQKPFAEALQDADAMIAACDSAHVPLLVHENFRWQRPFLEIAERLRQGVIGQPHSLRLTFHHAYDIYRAQPYLLQTERLALMDVGLHLFDLVRVLMGEVRSIHCRTQRLKPSIRGEDSFVATLQHDSGISVVDCSFYSHRRVDLFPQTLALIEGTRGSLELMADYRLAENSDGVLTETRVEPPVPAWGAKPWHVIQDSVTNFQRHVIEVLEGRASAQPSGVHNRDTLALAFAAYQSAETNASIKIAQRTRTIL
ncbi:MAG: Gfo/Idh/MocA family oxidoreductase [Terracidiphilus sp.]